jgi:flavin reductase (DIM6/NTAB) family NADH-FMN oxidoreductase RutF
MSKITWRGGTIIAPLPVVLVSSGTVDNPNVMTAAWTGIINTIPAKTYVSIRPERYSHEIISKTKEFVINLTTSNLVYATDWCGVKSGKQINKFEKMKLTPERVSKINAPSVGESPVNLECKVTDIVKLGSHDMFLADIVAVNVDEKLIDKNGKLHLDKANLMAYSHGEYFELGKKIGKFGYSVQKKQK